MQRRCLLCHARPDFLRATVVCILLQEATAIPIVEVNGGLAGQWNEENPMRLIRTAEAHARGSIAWASSCSRVSVCMQGISDLILCVLVSLRAGAAIAS